MDYDAFVAERKRSITVPLRRGVELLRCMDEHAMAGLVVFLDARLADDERAAKDAPDPDRALRECLWKRQILDTYLAAAECCYDDPDDEEELGRWRGYAYAVLDLAEIVYMDHPAFPRDHPHLREFWRPCDGVL